MRDVIAQEALGDPIGFDVFEGGPFEWPVRAPAYFDPSAGGVGVLADIGSHMLDLLGWWFGAPHDVRSADDAMGGVEANALLSLRCGGVPGRLRFSRDWHRPNHATVKGTRGVGRWHLEQADRIQLAVDGVDPSELLAPAGSPRTFLDCFERQMRDVLAAVRGEPAEVVEASEVLPSVAALEAARHSGSLLSMPWFSARELAVARSLRSL
jgi:predicted dehydrogenase